MATAKDILEKYELAERARYDILEALSFMCTTEEQDDDGIAYGIKQSGDGYSKSLESNASSLSYEPDNGEYLPLLMNAEFWPDIIARRASNTKTADGKSYKPYLRIGHTEDGKPYFAGYESSGLKQGAFATEPYTESNQVKYRVISEIPYEDRVWTKFGWTSSPEAINNAFLFARDWLDDLIGYQVLGGDEGIAVHYGNSFAELFRSEPRMLFFPDLKKGKNGVSVDTSMITNWTHCFAACPVMQFPPEIDTSGAVETYGMFTSSAGFKVLPKMDLSHVKYNTVMKSAVMKGMFSGCSALVDARGAEGIGTGDCIRSAILIELFFGCGNLKYIPNVDCAQFQNFSRTFSACYSLVDATPFVNIGEFDSYAYNKSYSIFTQMFENCTSLTHVNKICCTCGIDFFNMFGKCSKLKEVELCGCIQYFDMAYSSSTTLNCQMNMFNDCASLTKITFCGVHIVDEGKIKSIPSLSGCYSIKSLVFNSDNISWKVVKGMISSIPAVNLRKEDGVVDGHAVDVFMTRDAYDSLTDSQREELDAIVVGNNINLSHSYELTDEVKTKNNYHGA